MLARNLESRSVDGHLAAMHFCFLPVQDSPVSLPSPLSPLLSRSVPSHRPSSHPPSSNHPSNLSFSPSTNAGLPFFLHRALSLTRSLARSPHYSCLPLLLARSLARSHDSTPLPAWLNIGAGVLHPFVLHASYHRLPAKRMQATSAQLLPPPARRSCLLLVRR